MNAMLAGETEATSDVSKAVVYPERNGKRRSDNTKQARWIMLLYGNLEALLRSVLAFVAADLMWYAKKGFPEECEAPDVFVAFGRPKGDRPSYKQWEEDDVGPQVVIEVWSPGNTPEEMERKDAFYAEHGVQEYYIYDPDKDHLSVYLRKGEVLRRVWFQTTFTSPLLGIRFDLSGSPMCVFYPDGRPFLTLAELEAERARIAEQLQIAEQTLHRMAELGRKARRGQATAEEVAELERLENEIESHKN